MIMSQQAVQHSFQQLLNQFVPDPSHIYEITEFMLRNTYYADMLVSLLCKMPRMGCIIIIDSLLRQQPSIYYDLLLSSLEKLVVGRYSEMKEEECKTSLKKIFASWAPLLPVPLYKQIQMRLEQVGRKRKHTEDTDVLSLTLKKIQTLEKTCTHIPRISEVCTKLRQKAIAGQSIEQDLKEFLQLLSNSKPKTINPPTPESASMVAALYKHKMCSFCGQRFPPEILPSHLDYEFRKNCQQAEKKSNHAVCRWYPEIKEWVDQDRSLEPSMMTNSNSQVFIIKTIVDEKQEYCCICEEKFESKWDHELENWIYEDVFRIGESPHMYTRKYGSIEEGENSHLKQKMELEWKGQLIHENCYKSKIAFIHGSKIST